MIKFTWPPSKPQRLRNTHMTPPPPSLAFICRPVLYSPPSLLCLRRPTPLPPFSLKQCDLPRKSSCLKAYSVLQDLSWIQIVDTWVFSLYVVTETFGSRKQLDFVWTKAPGCQLIHFFHFFSFFFPIIWHSFIKNGGQTLTLLSSIFLNSSFPNSSRQSSLWSLATTLYLYCAFTFFCSFHSYEERRNYYSIEICRYLSREISTWCGCQRTLNWYLH